MANTSAKLRDLEVAVRTCMKEVVIATGVVVRDITKVTMVDGLIYYYDVTNDVVSNIPFVEAVGNEIKNCDELKDVEFAILCDDVNGDGTSIVNFKRRYVYSTDGLTVLDKADFELDGSTVYSVSDEANVKVCAKPTLQLAAYSLLATDSSPVTIPAGAKSFTITNLGLSGEGIIYEQINVTGGYTQVIPKSIETLTYDVQDENSILQADTIVTPANAHQAFVQWVL